MMARNCLVGNDTAPDATEALDNQTACLGDQAGADQHLVAPLAEWNRDAAHTIVSLCWS